MSIPPDKITPQSAAEVFGRGSQRILMRRDDDKSYQNRAPCGRRSQTRTDVAVQLSSVAHQSSSERASKGAETLVAGVSLACVALIVDDFMRQHIFGETRHRTTVATVRAVRHE